MRPVYLTLAVLMLSAFCLSQQASQKAGATEMTGQKTVIGCIAYGAPSGFILKKDDGSMVPLRTDRDLSPFVGKKVEIQATWTRTGVSVAEGETATAAAEGKPGAKAAPGQQMTFAGALRLQYKGRVLGDCK